MSLFAAFFLPLVVSLGFWQVSRAEQKQHMAAQLMARMVELPQPVTPGSLAEPFTRVRVNGELTEEIFLVDNQVRDGRQGYWILQGLQETSGRKLLVNRGWIEAPSRRDELPVVPTPSGIVSASGYVWPFTGLLPLVGEDQWREGWPKRVQRLDAPGLAAAIQAHPVEIRLEAAPIARFPAPDVTGLNEATHRGYAATWFGLALALIILYVIWGIRRAREVSAAQTEPKREEN